MDVIRFEENSSEGWTSYSLSTTQYSKVIEPEQECTCLCRICMKSWISCWLPLCIWPVCDAHCVFAWLSRGRAGGIWCGNARGHNQACLKCKIGCSKYSYLISKEYKFEHSSWDFVTHNSQISFIVFDTTCSHDHIAAAYTNYQRIDRLLALWLKLTPVKSLKCEFFFFLYMRQMMVLFFHTYYYAYIYRAVTLLQHVCMFLLATGCVSCEVTHSEPLNTSNLPTVT